MSASTSIPSVTPTSGLKRWVAKRPLPAYFIMAFAFSWVAVLPLILSRSGLISVNLPTTPFLILGALLGPTLSAYIATWVQSGRTGMRQLLARYVQWRVGLGWYLLVLFGPLVVLTLGAVPFLGSSILVAFSQNLPLLLSLYLPALVVGIFFGPLWEEPGWRGFALPRLQTRYGALLGSLILGVLWGLWHFPGFLGGWLGPLSVSSFAALLVGTTAFSIIMTWVYNNTQGSLLIMILMHSAFNAASSFGSKILPANIPGTLGTIVYSGWIPAATYAVCALLVIVLTRSRLSYRSEGDA